MHIGVAGLGRMGAAMAGRLIEVGHQVTVWNRSAGKAKSLVDAGAKTAASPAALASAVETVITCLTDADAIDKVYGGPSGSARGRPHGQARDRDEHGAARRRDRARRESSRQGRRFRRMPGRRLDRPGAPGQADRPDGRRARRCGARQAHSRSALPAARALRPGRRGRDHEVHHQHAADDLLAGARRGVGVEPPARPRSGSRDGSLVRHVRRAECAEGARRRRSPSSSRASSPAPSRSTSTAD